MYDDIDIKKDLFAIGIQTREQLEMFIKGANKVHCIDGTHSTNKYEFPLTTVIVPDEFNKGYPVGWLISNRNDELTLRPFLEEIKSRCPGDFTVNCLMTDDDNSGWNAFSAVFGETKHHLCKWHITRAWRRNLKLVPESQQDEVMQHLLVILNEKDASQFEILQRGFLKKCFVIAPAFAKYFQDRYVRRAEKWAMCYRQFEHCNTDTNMFVESFHNKLKTFFMERPNKRIDDLINLLLTIEEEDYWHRKRSLTYYGNLKNISIEDSRHTKGLSISDAKVEKLSESEWTVQSQSRDGCQYNVRMFENKCTDNDCLDRSLKIEEKFKNLKLALPCFGLCAHLYSCNCLDTELICKHIHKVHSLVVAIYTSDVKTAKVPTALSTEDEEFAFVEPIATTPQKIGRSEIEKYEESTVKLGELVHNPIVASLRLPNINKQLQDIITQCKAVAMLSADSVDSMAALTPIYSETEWEISPNEKLDTQLRPGRFEKTKKVPLKRRSNYSYPFYEKKQIIVDGNKSNTYMNVPTVVPAPLEKQKPTVQSSKNIKERKKKSTSNKSIGLSTIVVENNSTNPNVTPRVSGFDDMRLPLLKFDCVTITFFIVVFGGHIH
ncbi:uncharacterized protein LOC130653773 [Hydractinia symbiolongicarpus]|uniref:uncharacterized protein LOC130653773 n=1 Tax=Hydractinia symbiolongicarpus TaxID=13093 RepID=UPI00254FCA27|nr:uncharacterized protein LOC130653773 [Hydractinia symbiolongicarpus]